MQRYNVTVPKKYTKDGEEKTAWNKVGTLVRFPATESKTEGYILELNMFPDTKFAVFEDKPREQQDRGVGSGYMNQTPQAPTEAEVPQDNSINPDDIPF